jgi:DNA invertase Pin-like site-specific DNA recombinase
MRAAIYVRLSNRDKTEGDSIESQLQLCRDEAARLDHDIVAEYTDDGYSGTLGIDDRPGLNEAYTDAKKSKFEIIIARSLARLSRANRGRIYDVLEPFEELGIQFYTFKEQLIDLDNILTPIRSIINADELDKIAERMTRGKYNKDKITHGGQVMFGYERVRIHPDTVFKIVPAEAAIVRNIYKDFLDGLDYSEIAAKVAKTGIPKHTDSEWNNYDIKRILVHEIYTGRYLYGKHQTKKSQKLFEPNYKNVPRIIDDKTFNAAQVKVKSLNRRSNRRAPSGEYLLRGLIHCDKCGGLYNTDTAHVGGKKYLYYVHTNYKLDKYKTCANRKVRLNQKIVDERIKAELIGLSKASPAEIVKEHKAKTKPALAKLKKNERLQGKIKADQARIRKLVTAGKFEADDYLLEKERLENELQVLKDEAEELKVVTSPKYFSMMPPDLEEDYYRHLETQIETDDFDYDTWCLFVDEWGVEVKVIKGAKTKLKAELMLISDLGSLSVGGTNGNAILSKRVVV